MKEIAAEILKGSNLITILNQSVFGMLFFTLIFIFMVWYAQYHWKRRRLYAFAAKRNGPFPLPFIGNALYFAGSNCDILSNAMKLASIYEPPFPVWLGHKLFFAVWKPDQLEIIMNSNHALEKEELYKHVEVIVSNGLLTASVPKWKRHRKLIMPTFNQKVLNEFVEIFTEKSEILVKQLENVAGKGTFDVFTYVSRCTLDIICETAMGVTVNAQTTNIDYMEWVDRALQIVFARMFVLWYHYDFIFNLTPLAKKQAYIKDKLRNFTGTVVREKLTAYRKEMQEANERPEALLAEAPNKKKTFLQQLIELSEEGANFTEEELREEVDTFLNAGSETTASVNSFVFIMLGMFPEIQDKVYEEVMEVIGPEKAVESTDLGRLVYLERVIKETMRLFPPGPLIVRAITGDIQLDKCTIPADSSVVMFILKLHMDPEIWPNPMKFDPDRFLPEEVAKRHPYSWLAFSGGPRNCAGVKYAMMAMKTLIATVVRKYRFSIQYKTIDEIKLKDDFVLKPVDGYKVAIELRN